MGNALPTALEALAKGFSVIPIATDGSKRPALSEWKSYQQNRANTQEIESWFMQAPEAGMGVIGGKISGNALWLDFDRAEYFKLYVEAAQQTDIYPLVQRVIDGYCEQSPNGVHILIRCEEPVPGNLKLAQIRDEDNEGKIKTVIETRGEGGYCITAPSNGKTHPSGKAYKILKGGFSTVVTVTKQQLDELLRLAKCFDEIEVHQEAEESRKADNATTAEGERPGDVFNRFATWENILAPHHWTKLHSKYLEGKSGWVDYWRRPGKDEGVSAFTGRGETGKLYVYSTNTGFEDERGYGKFYAYSWLNFNKDYSLAGKFLFHTPQDKWFDLTEIRQWLKYNSPATSAGQTAGNSTEDKPKPKRLWHVDELAAFPPPVWLIKDELERNSLSFLVGESGCGKSFIGLDYGLRVAQTETTIYIAGEGASGYKQRIDAWREFYNPEACDFYLWPQPLIVTDLAERTAFLAEIEHLKPSLIVIDTLARSAVGLDENSARDMGLFVSACDHLKQATGACVMVVHHTGKNGGVERGSSALRGAADTMIKVVEEGDLRKIVFDKQKNGAESRPRYILLKPLAESLVVVPSTKDEVISNEKISGKVLEVLEVLAGEIFTETGATWRRLIELLGWDSSASKKTQLFRILNKLLVKGYIRQAEKGEPYFITTEGMGMIENKKLF